MKKSSIILNSIILSSLVLGLASFRMLKTEAIETSNTDLVNLLNEYYNNGVYTRRNSIKFNEVALEESIENYFVAKLVNLERTTYFSGETLLMGNYDGTITNDGINSGYTTIDGDLYHYVLDLSTMDIDESTLRKDVVGKTMEEFYVTMHDFATNDYYRSSSWEYEDGIYRYYPENKKYDVLNKKYYDPILNDFLAFTASCYYNADENNYNYVGLDYVEIEEVGEHLELRLYSGVDYSGLFDNDECMLSIAKVYKNYLPMKGNGTQLIGSDGSYTPLTRVSHEDFYKYDLASPLTKLKKNTSYSLYNSNSCLEYNLSLSSKSFGTFINDTGSIEAKVDGQYDICIDLNSTNAEVYTTVIDEIPERVYTPIDTDTTGIDTTDLSGLKAAFDAVTTNYTIDTQTYFNVSSNRRVNDIYSTNYSQTNTTKVTNDKVHIYNHNGLINNLYIQEDVLYKMENENKTKVGDSIDSYFFNMNDLNSEFVESLLDTEYSGNKVYLGWTRIGKNTYFCGRKYHVDVLNGLLAPGFTNGGTYMTFDSLVVELNPSEGVVMNIKLYASTTQSGKICLENKDKTNDWYMLFAEGNVYNVGTTIIE